MKLFKNLFKNWTIEKHDILVHGHFSYPTPVVERALMYKGTIVLTWRK